MKLDQACSEICRVGRSLFERGYVHATAGNISVGLALDQGFVVTPTDACLGFLEPARLAWVSASGELMRGDPARPAITTILNDTFRQT